MTQIARGTKALSALPKRMITAGFLATLAWIPSDARAEASHHVPASGQVVSPAILGDVRILTDPRPPEWDVRVFPSVLVSSEAFDDDGMRSALVGADRITLVAFNAYAERRFGPSWGISAATSFQVRLARSLSGPSVAARSRSSTAAGTLPHGASSGGGNVPRLPAEGAMDRRGRDRD